ncbi:transcription initiation factor TFIID subunit 9 [Colletotrichum salicis]|uniref:Transcription initiation factor TFIID subunit 9 n=1 Tax=Colletotrichum salicis TaxID=1209931 RepID=A0A135TSE2_9PEZI|nr:transcription initiation factor TFIID subunit 9 [Colletotrichum salicis]
MASQSADPQTNGVPASSGASASQTAPNTQATATTSAAGGSQPPAQTQPTQSSSTQQTSQPSQQNAQQQPGQQQQQQQQSTPLAPNASAPRPRDSRMIELLLTSQGVTSYESRVPLLLLDFAYRHTSSILSDAIYLSADPYTSQAGSKASGGGGGGAGSIPGAVGDAAVSANAVKLAIAARLGYQFRGGAGAGGVSKDWLQELARERNKTALPKVAQNEWGLRLPSERFVLSGVSWGLKEAWEEAGMDDDEDEDDEDGGAAAGPGAGGDGAMEGVEATNATADEDIGGDGVEGGTMEDVFGKDVDEDAEMEGTS